MNQSTPSVPALCCGNGPSRPSPIIFRTSYFQSRPYVRLELESCVVGLSEGCRTRSSLCCLRCDGAPETSLLFGAVFRDPTLIRLRERALESSGFKVLAIRRRSGLLPPGIGQSTPVDWV